MVDSRSYKEMRVQGGDRERGEGCCKWYIDGEHEKELEISYQGVYERERQTKMGWLWVENLVGGQQYREGILRYKK